MLVPINTFQVVTREVFFMRVCVSVYVNCADGQLVTFAKKDIKVVSSEFKLGFE